jgi:hypothetical protein
MANDCINPTCIVKAAGAVTENAETGPELRPGEPPPPPQAASRTAIKNIIK